MITILENKLAYETRYTLIDRILRIPGVFNNVDTLNSIFKTNKCNRVDLSRAGFYVAVTIAKHSVVIVCDKKFLNRDKLKPFLLPEDFFYKL